MTYQRFEDLPVWQEAARLMIRPRNCSETTPSKATSGFRDQLDRADSRCPTTSPKASNAGTTQRTARVHLHRARLGGRSALNACIETASGGQNRLADGFKSEISNLKSLPKTARASCAEWADSLQNSEIKGQRHLNDRFARNGIKNSAPSHSRNGCWKTCPPAIRCAGRRRNGII